MTDRMQRQIRGLQAYCLVSTTLLTVLALAAFRHASRPRFEELDVERLNVVEKDGTLRLVLANRSRLPELRIGGKVYPLRGGTGIGSAGLIFFNDEGNENGGLVYAGGRDARGAHASAHLTFDQLDQDETVALSYTERDGRRGAGLTISDRPAVSIQAMADSIMAIRADPDSARQAARMRALQEGMRARGEVPATRVYVGKLPDRSAVLSLADAKGRPRLRLAVDSAGAARIEFLDAEGKVARQVR